MRDFVAPLLIAVMSYSAYFVVSDYLFAGTEISKEQLKALVNEPGGSRIELLESRANIRQRWHQFPLFIKLRGENGWRLFVNHSSDEITETCRILRPLRAQGVDIHHICGLEQMPSKMWDLLVQSFALLLVHLGLKQRSERLCRPLASA